MKKAGITDTTVGTTKFDINALDEGLKEVDKELELNQDMCNVPLTKFNAKEMININKKAQKFPHPPNSK